MTTTTYPNARRRQFRTKRVIFAGAAAVAMFALLDAARPDATQSVLTTASVRLVDQATDLAPYPQTPPGLAGGFAADDGDDQAQQQAQLQQQLAMQEMQQAEQQAEEQNELAQQQAQQAEQQGQQVEQQANNP
jgi:hypothetical protein